ncbi:Error-prone repair homolog of DNA polymerase III alpha subunit (EC [Amycolatopsis camponoti]|uniref:Error-prone DNA polymerase n=1 Tax=Amycolatopsis camponoti TaxID=2606593 RepID=A0A6I8LKI6_9PSEU|nr:error-prone DNA polymerase [Amycolatopsis camponoti]VVJ16245.1 Error-prone repair homolog of DNA polymerase III alpha subunit (EC [Amycolatopsis camponoti]
MAFNNPNVPWSEVERIASGRPPGGDGNDAPAWSRKREGYAGAPKDLQDRKSRDHGGDRIRAPYAELHVHSNFSFLDGASHPETLVEEAARLELDALVLTDHDGMYGAVRFNDAARELGVRVGFGAELSLDLPAPQAGEPDPKGSHLLVIARQQAGYHRLCKVISRAQLAGGEKGRPVYDVEELVDELAGHVVVLTGCRKGPVRRALAEHGPAAARAELGRLADWFGPRHVAVELIDHRQPLDDAANDHLAGMARELRLPTVVSNNAHYARPEDAVVADAVAAVRARRSAEDLEGWRPPSGQAFLRSGMEQRRRFERRYPGAVGRAAVLGVEVAFDLNLVAPDLPPFPVPPGHDEMSFLSELTRLGAAKRYGSREENPKAYAQLDHELAIIGKLDFPGYFLVVWDIVRFCRESGILCQGRGSAANSAVCYALEICHADPVKWNLLFERFLAPERDGPPDIDVDIESGRREEAIQYVYEKHGRFHAAQVANVITYRAPSAIRDAAKALGHSPGQQDAYSKLVDRWGGTKQQTAGDIPADVLDLAARIEDFPRHLGIHSGGMVISKQPVSEVVPVEWATMADRSVLQWDKDDCATVGLVKFDLLGLGMLSALHYTIDLVAEHHGSTVDLGELDLADPNVYDMLCEADAIGVFQVESRAQLATLPRLRPREFYDLVVEVALIRPGPIQGGSVHPYIRRRREEEKWQHAHPLLASSLDRTLGVPLFQEQVMQMAVDVASFTPAEADQLRRAMGAKRSSAKMKALMARFFAGCEANGLDRELATRIFEQIHAFSGYGFPEAHSMSFALLVYASAWFKRYYPAAFCAGLLRAQPMGFYSPQSLVADARRHGVRVREPDLNASLAHATLEPDAGSTGGVALRLGLAGVRHLGDDVADSIVAERDANGPYAGAGDLTRRVRLKKNAVEALATAGAFGGDRRQDLWAAGAAATTRPGHLPGLAPGLDAPALPGMTRLEVTAADLWATGVSPDSHPVEYLRELLTARGALPVAELMRVEDGTRVWVGGAVTHRQRPATAGGITFLNLEDETGMANVLVSPGLWQRQRLVARTSAALLIRGRAQVAEGVVTLVADRLERLDLSMRAGPSRDFR